MKHYVVSAFPERRPQIRSELSTALLDPHIVEAPLGREVADTDPDLIPHRLWRDPLRKRLMTWGELACFAGHRRAWRLVAESEAPGGVILEDDARFCGSPLASDRFGLDGDDPDLVFLGHRELRNRPEGTGTFDFRRIHPSPYSYWCVGYWLSRETARRLIDAATADAANIIPLDEWLPHHYGQLPDTVDPGGLSPSIGLRAWSVDTPVVQPGGLPSGTETQDWAFDLLTVVFGTDAAKAGRTVEAFRELGHDVTLLGEGSPGWDVSKEGGRPKIEWLRGWLAERADLQPQRSAREIALATDGYDVRPTEFGRPGEFLKRYGGFGPPLCVGGEAVYWPERDLRERFDAIESQCEGETAIYPYPCSGALMGDSGSLLKACDRMLAREEGDDQALVQYDVLDRPDLWWIDREAHVFAHLGGSRQDYDERGRNKRTGCWPLLRHSNGPAGGPPGPPPDEPGLPGPRGALSVLPDLALRPVTPIGEGIYARRVAGPESAALLARSLMEREGWKSAEGDPVPGDELRLRHVSPELHTAWAKGLEAIWNPWIAQHWHPSGQPVETHDLFAIRYSADRQPAIPLHCDKSRFSGSLILETAKRGGVLHWPRQGVDDRHLAPGMMTLWPAPITHPHAVTPVAEGRRISLVWWTRRRPQK